MNRILLPAEGKKFASIKRETLDNGLRIFVNEKHEAPVVTVQVWVKTGSIHEEEYLGCGLSHFLEHMMFQGTQKYPDNSAAKVIHKLGGEANAYTSYNCTVYYIDLPACYAENAIDILSDMLIAPLFPEKKFESEKNVILRERDMYRDKPAAVLAEKLWYNIFSVHPARHPIIGYHDKIELVNREIMSSYYCERYTPGRVFLFISGDVDSGKIFKMAEQRLNSFPRGALREPVLPVEPDQHCPRSTAYTFNDPLSRLIIGYKTPDASGDETPVAGMLAAILGQNKSSPLIRALRDEKELALNISAFNYAPSFCGIFGISASCQPEKTEKLKDAIFTEIEKTRHKKFKKHEIEREVNQQITDYIRSLRTNSGIARVAGNSILAYGDPEYADSYLERIAAITRDDIINFAEKYLLKEKSTLVEQLPESSEKKITKKKTAPQPGNLPAMLKKENGAGIITFHDNTLPLVDICVIIPGGVINETAKESGISKMTATTLALGTKSFSEEEFAEFMDDNAIEFNVVSGSNSIALKLNCHKNKLEQALKALESVITEPLFPEKQFGREKNNCLDSLKTRALDPRAAAEDKLIKLLFGEHPYSRPQTGQEKTVKKFTAEKLRKFYFEKCLNPGKAVFGVAGDIDEDEIKEKISAFSDIIPWNTSPAPFNVPPPVFPKLPVRDSVTLPREQAVVISAMPSCDMLDEDYYALDFLYPVLNGQASPLFKAVREKEGLAYFTGMYMTRGIHRGALGFYAGTHPAAAGKVIAILDSERLKLAEKGISKGDFNAAKACVRQIISEQFEKTETLILNSALSEYYGKGFMNPWEKWKIYDSLSREKVNRVIRKYFDTDSRVTVSAGPGPA